MSQTTILLHSKYHHRGEIIFKAENFFGIYFEGYQKLDSPLCAQFIEVLVLLASIRRSLFSEAARESFINQMITGISELIKDGVKMKDVESYHHTCRLLARFGSIHAFYAIGSSIKFSEFIMLALKFTLEGLTLWEIAPNSITPLLVFWSRLSADIEKVTLHNANDELTNFQTPCPEIVKGYLMSMLATSSAIASKRGLY